MTPISPAAFLPGRRPACRPKANRARAERRALAPLEHCKHGGRSMRRMLLLIALVIPCFAGGEPASAQGRARVVNVYNWSDYIDPTVIDEFTKSTGIKVRYDTFDSNDTLEAKLLAGKS